MNILVTGGAGAIGSNLVKLLAPNNNITVLDDLSSGNMANLKDVSNTKVIKGSITDDILLETIFNKKIDIVYHLAAFFANQNSLDYPFCDLDVNGKGTLKLLDISMMNKVERFIYASSSCVSGQIPITPYAATKKLGEDYCHIYNKMFGLSTLSLQFNNSYGEGEYPGKYRNIIPNWIARALKGEDLIITGTGNETRDFTYVDDVVNFISMLTMLPCNGTVSIGTGKETKIIDLANLIIELTESKSKIIFANKRSWDTVNKRVCDTSRLKKITGRVPETTLKYGLMKTIAWMKTIL